MGTAALPLAATARREAPAPPQRPTPPPHPPTEAAHPLRAPLSVSPHPLEPRGLPRCWKRRSSPYSCSMGPRWPGLGGNPPTPPAGCAPPSSRGLGRHFPSEPTWLRGRFRAAPGTARPHHRAYRKCSPREDGIRARSLLWKTAVEDRAVGRTSRPTVPSVTPQCLLLPPILELRCRPELCMVAPSPLWAAPAHSPAQRSAAFTQQRADMSGVSTTCSEPG